MPGLITHYLLGYDVLDKMSLQAYIKMKEHLPQNNIRNIILKNRSAFNLGLPGPDIFFYHLPSLIGKNTINIGSTMHSERTGRFFNVYIDYMNTLDKREKEIAISYLCGFLCHYVLDATAHPFVYYHCGFSTTGKDESNIYGAMHRTLETDIDTVLLKKLRGLKPSNFNQSAIFKLPRENISALYPLMVKSINKTYDLDITKNYLKNIILSARQESKILQNKTGRKKVVLSYIENKTVKIPIITSLIHTNNIPNKNDCLNESHKQWYLPWDNKIVKKDSFIDLFNNSSKSTLELFDKLNNYLYWNLDKNILLKSIGNNSYYTGIDCNNKVFFKYHKSLKNF